MMKDKCVQEHDALDISEKETCLTKMNNKASFCKINACITLISQYMYYVK